MRPSPMRWLLLPAFCLVALPLRAQLATEESLTRRDQLLAADRAVSEASAKGGILSAVVEAGAEDLVVLWPGAPLIERRDRWKKLAAAQPVLPVRWVPLSAELSADGAFGVSYGVMALVPPGGDGGSLRLGKYLSAWRRSAEGWRLVAQVQMGVTQPKDLVLPDGFAALPLAAIRRGSPVAAFADADAAFAAQAGREGAAAAFAAWAADDAVTFAGTGELNRGPAAIRHWLSEDGTQSSWTWRPVIAGGSAAGDLGFTVGESAITVTDSAGTSTTHYGKYLTAWRRNARGEIRFIGDGGNARPSPSP